MADNGIFVQVFYPGFIKEALDKKLCKLALSYDGRWTSSGQLIIEPNRRDLEFEFSNERRVEEFKAELSRKYPDVGIVEAIGHD